MEVNAESQGHLDDGLNPAQRANLLRKKLLKNFWCKLDCFYDFVLKMHMFIWLHGFVWCKVCLNYSGNDQECFNKRGEYQTKGADPRDPWNMKQHLSCKSHKKCYEAYLKSHPPDDESDSGSDSDVPDFVKGDTNANDKNSIRTRAQKKKGNLANCFYRNWASIRQKIQFMVVFFMVRNLIPDYKYRDILTLLHNILSQIFPHLPDFTHTSRTSFLVFLSIIAEVGMEFVVRAYKKTRLYALACDEYSDVAHIGNIAFYIKIFDENWVLQTYFLCTRHITFLGCSSVALYFLLAKVLHSYGISRKWLVHMVTDGASVMTGLLNGLVARLCRKYPILNAIHCWVHTLVIYIYIYIL
jgi:hypothetical protein